MVHASASTPKIILSIPYNINLRIAGPLAGRYQWSWQWASGPSSYSSSGCRAGPTSCNVCWIAYQNSPWTPNRPWPASLFTELALCLLSHGCPPPFATKCQPALRSGSAWIFPANSLLLTSSFQGNTSSKCSGYRRQPFFSKTVRILFWFIIILYLTFLKLKSLIDWFFG